MIENLIELVRQNPCLYDTNDGSYRNMKLKAKLWKHIGKEVNESGTIVKTKWKSLRDNYIRYKKEAAKDSKGAVAKKFARWPWSTHLQFLDATLSTDRRKRSMYVDGLKVPQYRLESFSLETHSSGSPSPETVQPEPEILLFHPEIKTETSEQDNFIDSGAEALRTQQYDAVDHLFQSYAQTFKSFTKQNQIKAKVELAKLFASIETEEMHQ